LTSISSSMSVFFIISMSNMIEISCCTRGSSEDPVPCHSTHTKTRTSDELSELVSRSAQCDSSTAGLGDVDELDLLLLGAIVQLDGIELARFLRCHSVCPVSQRAPDQTLWRMACVPSQTHGARPSCCPTCRSSCAPSHVRWLCCR
jgi:hypothetical protein